MKVEKINGVLKRARSRETSGSEFVFFFIDCLLIEKSIIFVFDKRVMKIGSLLLLFISILNIQAQNTGYKTNGFYHGLWKSQYYFKDRQEPVVVYNYNVDVYNEVNEVYFVDRIGDTAMVSSSVLNSAMENWKDIKWDIYKFKDGKHKKDSAVRMAKYLFVLDSLRRIEDSKKAMLRAYNDSVEEANEIIRVKNNKSAVMVLKSVAVDESEHTKGTGYRVVFLNQSKKVFKYITFQLNAYNAVNDLIETKSVRGVGPIDHLQVAEYKWDYVWFTDLVEKVQIAKITIQFMDGTFATILTPKTFVLDYLTVEEVKRLKK